jgi:hypothetical protein
MTTGTFNAKIKHTGAYVKVEAKKESDEKFLWLMVKAEVPEDGKEEDYQDTAVMRIVAPYKTPVKDLIDKAQMMLLQSGVRMTIMAMAQKIDEQKAEEESKKKIIPQELGLVK